ncbi:MAG: hypothetical protein VX038_06165 [Verrucomicrobiota bacterium]|nr:hypothetical protein [Verrucomicrobiota bacterium]
MKNFNKIYLLLTLFFATTFSSCLEDDEPSLVENSVDQNNKDEIERLENQVSALKWELSRISLKIRTVNGRQLVRDKKTNLWHYDVERTPYTGKAVEFQDDGNPLVEAYFLKGKRDGLERFWFKNGKLKTEGQWFDGKKNGIFRKWSEQGKLVLMQRFKADVLEETLLD